MRDKANQGLAALTLHQEISSLERSAAPPAVQKLIGIVQKCKATRNPALAGRLLAYVRKSGLESHSDLGNYLAPALVACGSLHDAQQVFDRLADPNHHSWNTLIFGYIESGELARAFSLYQKMQAKCVHPNTYTFVALLKACGGMKDLEMGRQLRAEIASKGLEKDMFISNALVGMFGKCGSLTEAQEVFDNLSTRDVVTYSAMIIAHAEHGCCGEALKYFEMMQSESVPPNAVTYICSLKACSSIGAIETGRQIYADIAKMGFDTDLFVGNTLVDMFCKTGSLVEGQAVFDKLPARDVISWNALMAGHIELGLGTQVLHHFAQMQLEGVFPDEITFICSLKASASTGAIEIGQCSHADIVKRGLDMNSFIGNALVDMYCKCGLFADGCQVFDKLAVRDVVSWGAVITGYAVQGSGAKVLECFQKMQSDGVSPDPVVLASTLKACSTLASIEKGLEVHNEIVKHGLERDFFIGSVLVHMYAEHGSLEEAQEAFDELPLRNIIAWSAMMKGYGMNHYGNMAVQCFEDMQEWGVEPDPVAFTCLLAACSHASMVMKGRDYFQMMTMKQQKMTKYHYGCMIDLLARSGYVYEAARLLDTMQCPPSKEMLKSLLTACKIHGEVDLGHKYFEQLVAMNPDDGLAYVMMTDMFMCVGRQDDAVRVEKLRKRNGSRKLPAIALIEMKNEVQEFVVGDSYSNEVSEALTILQLQLMCEGYVPSAQLVKESLDEDLKIWH